MLHSYLYAHQNRLAPIADFPHRNFPKWQTWRISVVDASIRIHEIVDYVQIQRESELNRFGQ